MTREDLSPIMQQAYDALPTEEQKREFLEQHHDMVSQMTKGAIARIQARNTSHNLNSRVRELIKLRPGKEQA